MLKSLERYRFLIYEYPFHTTNADEQIDFAAGLLKALSIENQKVIELIFLLFGKE